MGTGLLLWIVYGTTFDSAGDSWTGLASWALVRLAAFGGVTGGAWLFAWGRTRPRHRA